MRKTEDESRANKRALNGMRGVHLVAAEVAKHGFAPVVTIRNTPFADILAQPLTFDGAPLSLSVKYSGIGTFFLLGQKSLPRSGKAFFVIVQELNGKPCRYWVVPSAELADSPTTKFKPGGRRGELLPTRYLGLHEGRWGYEVYFKHLAKYEGTWSLMRKAAESQ
jgi:hypothetical protein